MNDRAAIIRLARRQSLDVLILDPFALLHSAEENSNPEMGKVMRTLHEIKERGAVTLVVAHHPRKKSGDSASDDGIDSMRGAGVVGAHSRVIFALAEYLGKLRLSVAKASHSRKPEPIYLEQLPDGPLVRTNAPEDPGEGKDRRAEIAIAFVESQPGPVSTEDVRERSGLATEVQVPAVRQYLRDEAAKEGGRIVKVSKTNWSRRGSFEEGLA